MWFLGHTALGVGLGLLVLLAARSTSAAARVLVLFPFFANLIDFFHLDVLRPYSHNVVGALGLPLVAIAVWWPWMKWSRAEAVALLAASLGEPIGDLLFGTFYPYAPVNWDAVGWFPFNGRLDLVVEGVLAVGLVVALAWMYRRLAGPRALLGFRGPLVISPAAAVVLTSVLFGGEIVVYYQTSACGCNGALGWAVLAEMIVADLLYAGVWIVALGSALGLVPRRLEPVPDRAGPPR